MLQCSSSKAKGGQGLSDTNSATYLTQVSCVVYTHTRVQYTLLLAHSTPLCLRSTGRVTWITISEMRPDCSAQRQQHCQVLPWGRGAVKNPGVTDSSVLEFKKRKGKKTWLKAAAYEGNEPLIYWPIRLSVYLFSSAGWMQFSDGAKWQSWPGGKTRTTRCCQGLKYDLFSKGFTQTAKGKPQWRWHLRTANYIVMHKEMLKKNVISFFTWTLEGKAALAGTEARHRWPMLSHGCIWQLTGLSRLALSRGVPHSPQLRQRVITG